MAEQQARHAEQSKAGAQESVQALEGQLAGVTRQLHQARQDHLNLELHFQVSPS